MLHSSGIRTAEHARRGVRLHASTITSMVQPYFALTEQLWRLSPAQMPQILRGYSLFFLAHVEVLRSTTLRIEQIDRLGRFYRELDYPDDPKAAHDVASSLVAAFGHIEMRPTESG